MKVAIYIFVKREVREKLHSAGHLLSAEGFMASLFGDRF
jgi:hypothetical protein